MFDLRGNLEKLSENLRKERKEDVYDVVLALVYKVSGIKLQKKQVYIKDVRCKFKVFGPQKVKILLLQKEIEEVFKTETLTSSLILEL